MAGGPRPDGLHETCRDVNAKETGLLYCFVFVIFSASVRRRESRGCKIRWRTMEHLFEKGACAGKSAPHGRAVP